MFFAEENEYQTSNKSEEELKKFTLEENLSEIKRSILIIQKGQQLQKIAIYSNLHNILDESDSENQILLNLVNQDILSKSEELQINCAKSLRKSLEKQKFKQKTLEFIFELTLKMLDVWCQQVVDEWILVFQILIQQLDISQIKETIFETIQNLSQSSSSCISRYISCRMIGFYADTKKDKIENQLVDKIRQMCQDQDPEIRKILAQEVLYKVAVKMNVDLVEFFILSKVIELIYDKNEEVKCNALDLIFKISKLICEEEQENRLTKIFLEYMSSSKEKIAEKMSYICGTVFETLGKFLIKNLQKQEQFFTYYLEFSKSDNEIIRKNFIFNLPGLIHLTNIQIYDRFKQLYIKMLFEDNSQLVREQCVIVFHSICQFLGVKEAQQQLIETYLKILKKRINLEKSVQFLQYDIESILYPFNYFYNEDQEQNIVKNKINIKNKNQNQNLTKKKIQQTTDNNKNNRQAQSLSMGGLSKSNSISNATSDDGFSEENKSIQDEEDNDNEEIILRNPKNNNLVLDEIISLIRKIRKSNNWRLLQTLLDQIYRVQIYFDSSDIQDKLIPLIKEIILEDNVQLKNSACHCLVQLVFHNNFPRKIYLYFMQFYDELLESKNYRLRQQCIQLFKYAIQILPKQIIYKYQMLKIMELHKDKVSNVVLKYASILFEIRKILDIKDVHNMQLFDQTINVILKSKNQDIVEETQYQLQIIKTENFEKESVKQDLYIKDIKKQQQYDKIFEQENKINEHQNYYQFESIDYDKIILDKKFSKKRNSMIVNPSNQQNHLNQGRQLKKMGSGTMFSAPNNTNNNSSNTNSNNLNTLVKQNRRSSIGSQNKQKYTKNLDSYSTGSGKITQFNQGQIKPPLGKSNINLNIEDITQRPRGKSDNLKLQQQYKERLRKQK